MHYGPSIPCVLIPCLCVNPAHVLHLPGEISKPPSAEKNAGRPEEASLLVPLSGGGACCAAHRALLPPLVVSSSRRPLRSACPAAGPGDSGGPSPPRAAPRSAAPCRNPPRDRARERPPGPRRGRGSPPPAGEGGRFPPAPRAILLKALRYCLFP